MVYHSLQVHVHRVLLCSHRLFSSLDVHHQLHSLFALERVLGTGRVPLRERPKRGGRWSRKEGLKPPKWGFHQWTWAQIRFWTGHSMHFHATKSGSHHVNTGFFLRVSTTKTGIVTNKTGTCHYRRCAAGQSTAELWNIHEYTGSGWTPYDSMANVVDPIISQW